MNECTPDYWFLGKSEQVGITDRTTKKSADIPKDQLLPGRATGWALQNMTWGLENVQRLVDSYTTGNKVTAFIDGDSYTTSLLRDLTALTGRSANFALFAGWQFTNKLALLLFLWVRFGGAAQGAGPLLPGQGRLAASLREGAARPPGPASLCGPFGQGLRAGRGPARRVRSAPEPRLRGWPPVKIVE